MAWSVLQSASASADGTTVAATFTSNVQQGTKIIAILGRNSQVGTPTVKDGANNPWTFIRESLNPGTGSGVDLYALDTPRGDVGTKPTITVTGTGGTFGFGLVIQEVAGLLPGNTLAMVDGTPGALGGTTASTGNPTYSSSAENEYLIAVYGDFGTGNTVVTAGGWTPDPHNINTSTSANCMVQYKNSTGGAETDGFTSADTGGWGVIEIAFRLALPPPSPPWQLQGVATVPFRAGPF